MKDIIVYDNQKYDNKARDVSSFLNLSNLNNKKINIQSLKHYEVDLDVYDEMYKDAYSIQNVVSDGKKSLSVYDKLNKDLFLALYKYKPEVVRENEMASSTFVNNKIIKQLASCDDIYKLREHCKVDPFLSMIGTELISSKTNEIITEWKTVLSQKLTNGEKNPLDDLDQLIQVEEEIDSLQQELESLQEELDSLLEQSNAEENQDEINELSNSIDEIEKTLDELNSQIENSSGDLKDYLSDPNQLEDLVNSLNCNLNESVNSANEEISEMKKSLSSWGFSPESLGQCRNIPYSSKKHIVEKLRTSSKLKKIAKLLGKFRESAIEEQKKKSKDGATAVKSITNGNKIDKVLPSEKMKMTNKTTKKDFYRRYNQKELMQYDLDSHKVKNKGPIICCIDTSGSMDSKRESWSKAVALTLLEIANIQKRDFAAILFSGRAMDPIVIEKDEFNPEKVIKIAEEFIGGGTDFVSPLEEALKLIKTSKFKKADIVFITDGEADIPKDFLNKFNRIKEEKDFSVVSILVGGRGRREEEILNRFSDTINFIDDLNVQQASNDAEALKKVFSI